MGAERWRTEQAGPSTGGVRGDRDRTSRESQAPGIPLHKGDRAFPVIATRSSNEETQATPAQGWPGVVPLARY